jgi:hypothetical protein
MNFGTVTNKEKTHCELCKGCYGEKYHILSEKKGRVSTNLDSKFLLVIRSRQDSKKNLLYCLTSSKIWLIPPVHDDHFTYSTKFKKQNPLQVDEGEPAPTQLLPWFDF